ncbi:hypothetical protein [Maritalea sp. S77]|uniref:hypothetical protein n=1 Tax=Maritalea sp. S77 TaxID=3415125 RepID=UPI003C7E3F3B
MPVENECTPEQTAAWLNQNCACQSMKHDPENDPQSPFFAPTPVFLKTKHFKEIEAHIAHLHALIEYPIYQATALADAPDIANHPTPANPGMFMSFDFHVNQNQLHLIEINTNAGGAMLVNQLHQRQDICCWEESPLKWPDFDDFVAHMFEKEWTAVKGHAPLQNIAIIDEDPTHQFLYEEFQLTSTLLKSRGYHVVIADPADLKWDGQQLSFNGQNIDLVYNRSTDFYLSSPTHAALRVAYLSDAIVLSPNPKHHALYASKANLTRLSDPRFLKSLNCSPLEQKQLQELIQAQSVKADNANELWQQRKKLFFKPLDGHAGKAVYRGDKLTKKSWAHILSSDYIAQRNFKPELRLTRNGDEFAKLKSDLRFYTYQGQIFAAAARLYAGQTTNFRTQGGGFAPIYLTKN